MTRPAELRLPLRAGLADELWERFGPLAVGEAADEIVATFASEADARAAAVAFGGTVGEPPAEGAWLDTWRAFARPARAGRLVVRPPWVDEPPREPQDVVIVIDPGYAFGHGGHPSSRLVLEALANRLRGGESVLDVGCGSGVLSIGALALGAKAAIALDIDPVAVAVTRENAERAGVADQLDVSLSTLEEWLLRTSIRRRFDAVLANIGVTVLRDLAPRLAPLVAPGGWLMLSGLLDHQWPEVVARCPGLTLMEVAHEDGWSAPILAARPL